MWKWVHACTDIFFVLIDQVQQARFRLASWRHYMNVDMKSGKTQSIFLMSSCLCRYVAFMPLCQDVHTANISTSCRSWVLMLLVWTIGLTRMVWKLSSFQWMHQFHSFFGPKLTVIWINSWLANKISLGEGFILLLSFPFHFVNKYVNSLFPLACVSAQIWTKLQFMYYKNLNTSNSYIYLPVRPDSTAHDTLKVPHRKLGYLDREAVLTFIHRKLRQNARRFLFREPLVSKGQTQRGTFRLYHQKAIVM